MSFQESEERRVTGEAKNVQLGDFITPRGNAGNATPGYVSDYNPWGNLDDLGRGISTAGRTLGKLRDAEAKAQEDQQASDFYNKVYNIQQMPTDIMSDAQKQVEINRLENDYKDIIKYETRNNIYNALGAGHKDSLIGMQQKAGREQLVEMEKNQNEEFQKFALNIDPAYATLTPAEQIQVGKESMDIVSAMSGASSAYLSTLGQTGVACVQQREQSLDVLAEYSGQLMPQSFKIAYEEGKVTDNDIYDYMSSMSRELQKSINPFTGTVLSKQQADAYAKAVTERLFDNLQKEKLEREKKTKEYNDAYLSNLRNNVIMNSSSDKVRSAYILTGGRIDLLADAYDSTSLNGLLESFGKDLSRMYALPNGHMNIPKDMNTKVKTLLCGNKDMPLLAADAFNSLTNDQYEQPSSLATNQNMLEQMRSMPDGWLNSVPSDYKKENVESLKKTLPPDIKKNIQSLVKVSFGPSENEGWLQRAIRFVNNVAVGSGTTVTDDGVVRGANADAIESMLNEYANELRRSGVDEKDVDDIISAGITSAGIKSESKLVSDKITDAAAAVRMGFSDAMNIGTTIAKPLDVGGTIADVVTEEPIEEEPEAQGNQPIMPTDDQLKQTPEYKSRFKEVMSQARRGAMTKEQVENELNVVLNNIKNGINAVLGVKTANAGELLPSETVTKDNRPIETVNDFEIVKLGNSAKKNNNIFNTRGKGKSEGFASFKNVKESIKEAIFDAKTKVERFKGDVMKLCEQYAPRADNNLTSRYCAGLLYRTPGVSDEDKQTLQAVVNNITQYKDKDSQLKADKENEGIIRHIANKYMNLFYRNGKVVTVKPIVLWQAKMETGTDLK